LDIIAEAAARVTGVAQAAPQRRAERGQGERTKGRKFLVERRPVERRLSSAALTVKAFSNRLPPPSIRAETRERASQHCDEVERAEGL
jgi:hypothetical protein